MAKQDIKKWFNKVKIPLIVGLLLIFIGWLWVYLSWAIPGFGFPIETSNGEFFANISFIVGYGLIVAGLFMFSKFENLLSKNRPKITNKISKSKWNDNRSSKTSDNITEVSVKSIPKSRIVVAILYLGLGIWTLIQFGANFGRLAYKGEFFTLGGPSVFYLMGAIPTLFAVFLLIYGFSAIAHIQFKLDDKNLTISEYRGFIQTKTKINPKNIETIKLNNTYFGPKLVWVAILIMFSVHIATEGFSLTTNPNVFGYGIEVGIMYIVSAAIIIIGLIILMLYKQDMIEITTKENIYELQFSADKNDINRLNAFLIGENTLKDEKLPIESSKSSEIFNRTKVSGNYTRIIIGSLYIVLAIVSRVLFLGSGHYLRWILFVLGAMWLFKGITKDLSEDNSIITLEQSKINPEVGGTIYKRFFKRWYEYQFDASTTNLEIPRESKISKYEDKPDVFDKILIVLLVILACFQLTELYILLPNTALNYGLITTMSTIFNILEIGLASCLILKKRNKKDLIITLCILALSVLTGIIIGIL